ncbi:MAG: OsmC family protein [Nitrososphaeraceae archaeon]
MILWRKSNLQQSTAIVYDGDEPAVLFGTDLAANPLEYVLVALNGCLTTALIYNASAQGICLEEVESTLEGNIDTRGAMGLSKDIRNGYENIKVSFRVKSSAPMEKIKELIEVTQKRSPVFDIISNPTSIEVTLQE